MYIYIYGFFLKKDSITPNEYHKPTRVSVKAATVLLIGASGRIFGLAATQNPMIITLEIATTWGFNPFWDVPLIIYIYILYIYLIYI